MEALEQFQTRKIQLMEKIFKPGTDLNLYSHLMKNMWSLLGPDSKTLRGVLAYLLVFMWDESMPLTNQDTFREFDNEHRNLLQFTHRGHEISKKWVINLFLRVKLRAGFKHLSSNHYSILAGNI